MSMYLPNPDLYPTGDEPAEFLEIPPMDQSSTGSDIPVEPEEGRTDGPDVETPPDITAGN